MFDAFALEHLDLPTGVRVRVRHGGPLPGGHHLAEDAPRELAEAIAAFLR